MLTKEERATIDETRQGVRDIKNLLFGVKNSSDKGFLGEFQALKKDYYGFKTRALIIFGVLVGSGVLVGGIYEVYRWFD